MNELEPGDYPMQGCPHPAYMAACKAPSTGISNTHSARLPAFCPPVRPYSARLPARPRVIRLLARCPACRMPASKRAPVASSPSWNDMVGSPKLLMHHVHRSTGTGIISILNSVISNRLLPGEAPTSTTLYCPPEHCTVVRHQSGNTARLGSLATSLMYLPSSYVKG